MKTVPKIHILILLAVITFHALANYSVVRQSHVLWEGSDGWQASEAVEYCRTITGPDKGGLLKAGLNAAFTRLHPQLYQFSLGCLLSLKPPEDPKDLDLPVQLLNALFLLILFFSVYGTGRLLYGAGPGLLAAVLLSFSPVIFGQARLPMLEIPQTALISLSVYFLLKSGYFSSTAMSFLAGLALGLAQITKETTVLFVLPVFLLYALHSFATDADKKKRIKNLSLCIITAAATAAAVYLNAANIKMYSNILVHLTPSGRRDYAFYLEAFRPYYLGWLAFFASLPLLASYLWHIRRRNLFITAWLAFPLFALMLLSGVKMVRFFIPALPALYLILSSEAFTPFFKKWGAVFPVLLVCLFVWQYARLNLSPENCAYPYKAYATDETGLLSVKQDNLLPTAEELAGYIMATKPQVPGKYTVAYLSRVHYRSYLRFLFSLKGIQFNQLDWLRSPRKIDEWMKKCRNADFLLEETSGDRKERMYFIDVRDQIRLRNACMQYFEPAREFSSEQYGYPSQVLVYKRKSGH